MRVKLQLTLNIITMDSEAEAKMTIKVPMLNKSFHEAQSSSESNQEQRRIKNEQVKQPVPARFLKEEKSGSIAKMQALLLNMSEQLKSMGARMDEVTSNTTEMKKDISVMKNNYNTMSQDIRQIRDHIDQLRVDVKELGNRMDRMQQRSLKSERVLCSALAMIAFESKQAANRTCAFKKNPSYRTFLETLESEVQAKNNLYTGLKQLAQTLQ